ncbi:Afadin and alpha-actinin-binding-domain-containing protein [Lipomyces arxii]|uniref:Afadin and alpha-actinin-binding-domain-containing protein n=1 Tax=Lipomyces arxii TaxID=56418 RepID=UPI0034CFAB36
MDAETDLYSASRRLNAALVSKGLLNEGHELHFQEGSDARRIINFVYDIVQQRDRDAESRENLVHTVREHKTVETRYKKSISQLTAKIESLERQTNMIAVQRDNFKKSIETLEAQNRDLQESMTRQKAMLQQLRAQDANERRKRDQQILRMKEKAGFEVRRAKSSSTISGKLHLNYLPVEEYLGLSETVSTNFSESNGSVSSFKQKANSTIPDVIQNLIDENARLTALTRETALTLNRFTGEKAVSNENFERVLEYIPTSFAELSIEINNSLEALREVLEEPKYVTIEEVEHRDREIAGLKVQLESMTDQWKEAIQTMDEYNRFMDGKFELPPVSSTKKDSEKAPLQQTQQAMDTVIEARDVKDGTKRAKSQVLETKQDSKQHFERHQSETDNKESVSILQTSKIAKPAARIAARSRIPSMKPRTVAESSGSTTHYPWKTLSEITNESSKAEDKDKENHKALISEPHTPKAVFSDMALAPTIELNSPSVDSTHLEIKEAPHPETPVNDDPLTPIVHKIMSDAGVLSPLPQSKPVSTLRQPLTRTLLQFTSSPASTLSPVKLSSLEKNPTPPLRSLKRQRHEEVDVEIEFADFSPVKLPKRFRFDR